ncbi:MAG: cytochrome c3 family protein [Planctomycetota bacterium]|jgi:predicted CXXCH cytochrome family protein
MSCDEVERHQVLTFFFDGVPPLDGEVTAEDSRMEADYRRRQGQQVMEQSEAVWFVHEPWKNRNCNNCHEKKGKGRLALSQSIVIAPVPELCYQCHTDYPAIEPYVHGPVAVGDCLFCHKSHKSRIAGLLKEEEPMLCYECHETIDAAEIPGHPDEPILLCTNCHDPHAGLTRMLLKEQ